MITLHRFTVSCLFLVFALWTPQLTKLYADDFKFKLPGGGGQPRSFSEIATTTLSIEPAQPRPGETVTVKFTISPKPDCYTYPLNPPEHQTGSNRIGIPKTGPLIFFGYPEDPLGYVEKPSSLEPGQNDHIYTTLVTWELKAVVRPDALPGPVTVPFKGTMLQACTQSSCLISKDVPELKFEIAAGPAVEVEEAYRAEVEKELKKFANVSEGNSLETGSPPTTALLSQPEQALKPALTSRVVDATKPEAVPANVYQQKLDQIAAMIGQTPTTVKGGLAGLLAAAVFWGFISLLTPCVFPMIPITISLFLKQSQNSTSRLIQLAAVYSVTIMVVLGLSALFLLSLFQKLSVDPYMNIVLGLLFIFFALSLFGMYDIQLPGFLLRAADKRRASGGMLGMVFGAITLSIVGFTCVAPFLGGFAGLTASGNFSQAELALAALAFSGSFAAPFFLLALFPGLLKQLPKSGNWMITMKAMMGFLELAAAIKFLRTAEIRLLDQPEYFTYEVALASWIVIAFVAGLYLLNLFRLPHDHDDTTHIGVLRMLAGCAFLGIALHLAPALWKKSDGSNQRPNGSVYAWVNAFLLPEPAERGDGELAWSNDLKGTIDRITRELSESKTATKPVIFLDFTGKTCSNCKLNENQVFTRPEVTNLLKQFSLVQLYTDEVPGSFYANTPDLEARYAEGAANQAFQERIFGTLQLPLYVLLAPRADGSIEVLGVYDEGKINNVATFIEFLKSGLKSKS